MKTQILSRYDSTKVLYESEKETLREAVIEAVYNDVDLRCADLRGVDLHDLNFSDVDFRDVDFRDANLRDTNFRGVSFRGADLRGANLSYADLSDVDFRGVGFRGVDLMYVKFYGRGGKVRIKKSQIESFHRAFGIVVEE